MNEKIIEIIEKRKEANLEILDLLKELVEKIQNYVFTNF